MKSYNNWLKDVISRQRDLHPGSLNGQLKGTALLSPPHTKFFECQGHDASIFA